MVRGSEVIGMLLDTRVEEFYGVAEEIAGALSGKYYTVSAKYSPSDIVQEVALKIIRKSIDFDESRGLSFSSFIYMLVNNAYIDLSRNKNVKNLRTVSIEEELLEDFPLKNTLSNGFSLEDDVLGRVYCEELIDDLPCESDRVGNTPLGIMNLSVRSVVKLKMNGYSADEIASFFGMASSNLNYYLRVARKCLSVEMSLGR